MQTRIATTAAAASILAVFPALAQEILIFATASPPQGPISTVIFEGWANAINADGAGVVEIDVRHGFTMANPGNFFDRFKDGVVPISWGIMSTIGGRFPLTGVAELPFLTNEGETASVAFWRLYAEGHLDAEYHEIVPLFLTVFPQSGIHLSAPIPSLDNLHGARVIAGSQTNGGVIAALGGVPLSISPADAYEAIQRGTADGRFVPWTAFPPFRMDEITSYHIEAPIGSAVGMVFMNREVWDGLPEEARAVIMRHSGEAQSRTLGAFFDRQQAGIRGGIAARAGHTIVSPDAGQMAAWEAALAPVTVAATLPAATAQRVHLKIDLLGPLIGPRLRHWLDLAGALLLLLFLVLLAREVQAHAGRLWVQGRTTPILGRPVGPFLMAVAALLWMAAAAQAVASLPDLVRLTRRTCAGAGRAHPAVWLLVAATAAGFGLMLWWGWSDFRGLSRAVTGRRPSGWGRGSPFCGWRSWC